MQIGPLSYRCSLPDTVLRIKIKHRMGCAGLDPRVEGVVTMDIFMGVVMGEHSVTLVHFILCARVCWGMYIRGTCLFSLAPNHVGGAIRDPCVAPHVTVDVLGIIFRVGEEELLIDKGLRCTRVCKIRCQRDLVSRRYLCRPTRIGELWINTHN